MAIHHVRPRVVLQGAVRLRPCLNHHVAFAGAVPLVAVAAALSSFAPSAQESCIDISGCDCCHNCKPLTGSEPFCFLLHSSC